MKKIAIGLLGFALLAIVYLLFINVGISKLTGANHLSNALITNMHNRNTSLIEQNKFATENYVKGGVLALESNNKSNNKGGVLALESNNKSNNKGGVLALESNNK
ncbi:MAG: hypothetical protein QM538_03285, partial [Methylacidiphilales bacterium]|nr:hypothetical protein [Candidatus Methylacidiphilales bacterium]